MINFKDVPTSAAEEAIIQTLVEATLEKQRKSHKPGQLARRDVHSKSLGTVNVSFRVLDNIPESVKVGLFAYPATYKGVLRFSNGAFGPGGYDILPNIRGLALKLFQVPGKKLMPGEEHSNEHDFLMANDRGFFIPKIEQYVLLTKGKMKELALKHPRVIAKIIGAMKIIKNPLTTEYYSQVPYQYGNYACKFALIPVERSSIFSIPNVFDKDYLRHGVENVLRDREVKFRFCVQFQCEGESLDDSSKVWRGRFIPVAELTVLRRDEPILESDGEGLSFNPWRATSEHQPLGWAGRTRRAVYKADFEWRTKENAKNAGK